MRGVEIACKVAGIKKELFKDYVKVTRRLKKAFSEVLGEDVRVVVFGSVVRGDYTPLSDLDVLVISKKAENVKCGEVVDAVERKVGKIVGVEIHLVTPEIFEKWYMRFLDTFVEV